jgi:hypothetical protein
MNPNGMADESIEEKINMRRDIKCVCDKQEKLERKFEERPSAKETDKRLNKFDIDIARMGDKLNNIEGKIDEHIIQQGKDFEDIKETLRDFIKAADGKYANDKDFQFWKQLLVAGIFVSIVLGVVGLLLQKFFH